MGPLVLDPFYLCIKCFSRNRLIVASEYFYQITTKNLFKYMAQSKTRRMVILDRLYKTGNKFQEFSDFFHEPKQRSAHVY